MWKVLPVAPPGAEGLTNRRAPLRRLLLVAAATAAVAAGFVAGASPASACVSPPSGPFWDAPAVCLIDNPLKSATPVAGAPAIGRPLDAV